jgi:carboxypeptidase family protein
VPDTVLHRGRVRWEDGTPVPGALVAVASGTAPTPEVAIRTNAAGEFGIALPAGTFSIEAHGPAGAKGSREVRVPSSEEHIDIVLKG